MGQRIKLTESLVGGIDTHLLAQGRDITKPIDVWDDGLRGLVLRREPAGKLSWFFRFQINGKRSRSKLGEWPALGVVSARAAAKIVAAGLVRGIDPVTEKRNARVAERARRDAAERFRDSILGAFVEGPYRAWAETHLRAHKPALDALRADFGGNATQDGRTRQSRSKKRCADWWGRPMGSITTFDVERWRRDQLAAGLQKATINRAWQRLRAVLGKAHEWGLCPAPIRIKRFTLDSRGRVRYLDSGERERLLRALDAREDRRREKRARMNVWLRGRNQLSLAEHGVYTDTLKPLVLLALDTGLRRNEALSLTWDSVDFSRGAICVRAATSKSGQSRDVPMTRRVQETLLALQADAPERGESHFVFTGPGGKRLRSIGAKTWSALLAEAEIQDFRFHDLRHDFATRLVMAGVDLFTVSKLLGHSDVAMSQRYAHLAPDYLKAAVAKLDKRERAA